MTITPPSKPQDKINPSTARARDVDVKFQGAQLGREVVVLSCDARGQISGWLSTMALGLSAFLCALSLIILSVILLSGLPEYKVWCVKYSGDVFLAKFKTW